MLPSKIQIWFLLGIWVKLQETVGNLQGTCNVWITQLVEHSSIVRNVPGSKPVRPHIFPTHSSLVVSVG